MKKIFWKMFYSVSEIIEKKSDSHLKKKNLEKKNNKIWKIFLLSFTFEKNITDHTWIKYLLSFTHKENLEKLYSAHEQNIILKKKCTKCSDSYM